MKQKFVTGLNDNLLLVLHRTKTIYVIYGAEKGKMILANLSCYKLTAIPVVKTTSLAEDKRCTDSCN
jgi:hypothetical protein